MKKFIILTMVLLVTLQLQAQSGLYLQVTQDVKLATIEDDYGNNPYTLDLSSKIGFIGNEGKIGHTKIGVKYEFADLYGGEYYRWGLEGGYSFTNLILPWTNYTYTLTPMIGFGHTSRGIEHNGSKWSYEGSFEFKFNILKNLDIVSLMTYTTRPDLPNKWGTPNWSVGVEWEIPEFWAKTFGDKHSRF